jgi:glycerophosphoryl diester phosphodiesterase
MRSLALSLAILASMPAAASAELEIHAHRGGPLATVDGQVVPVLPEESMRAFLQAHEDGFVIELDAKLTSDGVPVLMHDATLDRTTDCSGLVRDYTAAQLSECRIDLLGTAGVTADNPELDRIPHLDEVLDWAKESGARLNLEIKNVPTDADFDPSPAFAQAVLDVMNASGLPKDQMLVQSFWPLNLDLAQLSGWRTALLTLNAMNQGGPAFATARGYDVLSPEWPLQDDLLPGVFDRPVVPWTLNDAAAIGTALERGVDGIISDNPGLVRSLAGAG